MSDPFLPGPLAGGDVVEMVRARSALVVGAKLGEGGQAAVYRARTNGAEFAVKWYRPGHQPGLLQSLQALVDRGRPPHPAFVWPIDMVRSRQREGFGYVMPLLEPRFISFARMLSATEPPRFRTLVQIGLELVDAFAALHASGLCYRDISFGNLWVDPASGQVAVIDNDNVGPDGGTAFVKGTPRFMAPEVLRDEALPGTVSDLHSLAAFLFYLFMFGHPLEGRAVEAASTWADGLGRRSEEEVLLEHFGTTPVFVFDPDDAGNRPVPGDPVAAWWPIYPRFLRREFTHVFTVGLRDPSLTGRITEGVWRRTLQRLADCVWACGYCGAAVFHDPDDAAHACWSCRAVPVPPLVALLPGQQVVLAEGAVLTTRHLRRPGGEQVVARAELHPDYPGRVLLRNVADFAWRVFPDSEEAKQVQPRQLLLLRPMEADFGGAVARIDVAHRAAGRDARQEADRDADRSARQDADRSA